MALTLERAKQLRQIANVQKKSVQEVLSDFIRAHVRNGTIEDSVEGFIVEAVAGGVRFGFDSTATVLTFDEAKAAARQLAVAAEGIRRIPTASGTASLVVKRRGRGVVIELAERRRSISKEIACDLALLLQKHGQGSGAKGL